MRICTIYDYFELDKISTENVRRGVEFSVKSAQSLVKIINAISSSTPNRVWEFSGGHWIAGYTR